MGAGSSVIGQNQDVSRINIPLNVFQVMYLSHQLGTECRNDPKNQSWRDHMEKRDRDDRNRPSSSAIPVR